MSRSRWVLPIALSVAALSTLGTHPVAGAPLDSEGFFPRAVGPIGPANPGAQLWVKRYNGPGNGFDTAYATGVSPDSSMVFVTGGSSIDLGSGYDYATVAHNASTGDQLWVKRYNGPGNSSDTAYALGVSPDGSKVFVTGGSDGATSSTDYATAAYNASTGTQLWAKRYNGPGNGLDVAYSLGVSPDGSTVFVTGRSVGATSSDDYATVAYNASTGARLWIRRYNGPGNGVDVANALGLSLDGSTAFVTGSSAGATSFSDYATVAYNSSTGAQRWVKRYNSPENGIDYALALGVTPDGSDVFVTGYVGLDTSDYATVAYNASTGARLWVKRFNGVGNSCDFATALGVSPDGSTVLVTGQSVGSGTGYDYATVAYNASTGGQLWVKRYNGAINSDDFAYPLRVSADGSEVFVTGQSIGSGTGYDYATVAYNASTGAQLWVTRYNGPANSDDTAFALGVSPNGSEVFVTGGSTGSGSDYDYATVAYSAT